MVWSEQLVEHSYSLPEIQESDPLGGNRAEFDATSCESLTPLLRKRRN
jgi:hypothetical protein